MTESAGSRPTPTTPTLRDSGEATPAEPPQDSTEADTTPSPVQARQERTLRQRIERGWESY
jgi:hypothetical protein